MNITSFTGSKNLTPSFLLRLAATFAFAVALPLVTLVIHTNPSNMQPPTPFASGTNVVYLIAGGLLVLWGLYFLIVSVTRKSLFLLLFFITFAGLALFTLWLGLRVHRDYFTYIFQLILTYWLLFILRNDLFASMHSKKHFYTFLFILNTVVFSAVLLWIILMGYAIATRQEPRWAESIVYNAYNTILIFFIGIASLRLQLQRFRNIRISKTGLFIDDWDFSRFFSGLDKRIVVQFLTNEDSLTCYMLETIIRQGGTGKTKKWNCRDCLNNGYTTTQCPKYKNLYNRILNIKKLFETLEIGTIITPENKMQIKEQGWKLRLFDDVRVIHRH